MNMIKKLMATGMSKNRAEEIIVEAENSSNKEYIYNYYISN